MEKMRSTTLTEKDLESVEEPCKSCPRMVSFEGKGNEKIFYCDDKMAQLIENPGTGKFSQIPYCPKAAL